MAIEPSEASKNGKEMTSNTQHTNATVSRRRFLKFGSGIALTPVLASWLNGCASDMPGEGSILLSGYRGQTATSPGRSIGGSSVSHGGENYSSKEGSPINDKGGKEYFGIAGINTAGQLVFDIPVQQRVHDSVFLPHRQQAVFFARRPGTHLYIVDITEGRIVQTVSASAQRHFYGHGCISNDGRYLFTSENAFDTQTGCIGVYDVFDNFRRIDEFPSGGIGPHQIEWLADKKTLVIANGGILTHPTRGRKKLNLDTMRPSLSYVESRSGKLIDEFLPPHHQQSIRHLDVSATDTVMIGIQFEGDPTHQLPLAYSHSGEHKLLPFTADTRDWQRHQQYIGSVCTDATGSELLLSSPRGGIVSHWNAQRHSLRTIHTQRDGAGLAFVPARSEFYASNGLGQITAISGDPSGQLQRTPHYFHHRSWDNHISVAHTVG